MSDTGFSALAEAETRHALLLSRILPLVVNIAPGLPGYYSTVELIDSTEIHAVSRFKDDEGIKLITQRIAVTYTVAKT